VNFAQSPITRSSPNWTSQNFGEWAELVAPISGAGRTLSVKQNTSTGNESFEHYRESEHDDIATAVMLPVFLEEKYLVPAVRRRYKIKPEDRPVPTLDAYAPLISAPESEGGTAITHTPVPPRVAH
jgi:hypothetical protein